jgi:hypothetical protein
MLVEVHLGWVVKNEALYITTSKALQKLFKN